MDGKEKYIITEIYLEHDFGNGGKSTILSLNCKGTARIEINFIEGDNNVVIIYCLAVGKLKLGKKYIKQALDTVNYYIFKHRKEGKYPNAMTF